MSVIMNVLNKVREENETSEVYEKPEAIKTAVKEAPEKVLRKNESPMSEAYNLSPEVNLEGSVGALNIPGIGPMGREAEEPKIIAERVSRLSSNKAKIVIGALICLGLIAILIFKMWSPTSVNQKAGTSLREAGKNSVFNFSKSFRNSRALQGVVLDGKEPYCLISGQIYKLGDVWNGMIIKSISQRGVALEDEKGKKSFLENRNSS